MTASSRLENAIKKPVEMRVLEKVNGREEAVLSLGSSVAAGWIALVMCGSALRKKEAVRAFP